MKFQKITTVVAAVSLALLAGCANQRFLINGDSTANPKLDDNQHFFVGGLGQKQTVDAAQLCGGADKVSTVDVQVTFLNGFLGFLSSGIYTPKNARVFCK